MKKKIDIFGCIATLTGCGNSYYEPMLIPLNLLFFIKSFRRKTKRIPQLVNFLHIFHWKCWRQPRLPDGLSQYFPFCEPHKSFNRIHKINEIQHLFAYKLKIIAYTGECMNSCWHGWTCSNGKTSIRYESFSSYNRQFSIMSMILYAKLLRTNLSLNVENFSHRLTNVDKSIVYSYSSWAKWKNYFRFLHEFQYEFFKWNSWFPSTLLGPQKMVRPVTVRIYLSLRYHWQYLNKGNWTTRRS